MIPDCHAATLEGENKVGESFLFSVVELGIGGTQASTASARKYIQYWQPTTHSRPANGAGTGRCSPIEFQVRSTDTTYSTSGTVVVCGSGRTWRSEEDPAT
jgi:hypothetical protein